LVDEERRARNLEMDPPVGCDLAGPDVQPRHAPARKVMKQERNRIQANSVLGDDDRAAAGALELGRHPEAADISPPRREGITLNERVGAGRMWHRWDRDRPGHYRRHPMHQTIDVYKAITSQDGDDPRETPREGI